MLQNSPFPFAIANREEGWILQQDNAPIHTPTVTKNRFLSANDIETLSRPARSPDLNPVENLWGVSVRKAYS